MIDDVIQAADSVLSRINTHPEYSSCAAGRKSQALREEAEKHSLDIEILSEDRKLSGCRRAYFRSQLDSAYELLASEGIRQSTVSRLGYLVEPKRNLTGGFRNESLAFGGFNAPSPGEVPYLVEHLIGFLKSSTLHPIVRAANAHLELVEIHPYMDGNGRSARLLQNFCLQERGYPAGVIMVDELEEYRDKIHNALRDRYGGTSSVYEPSISEAEFQEFVGQRVLRSVTLLEEELRKRRMYEIELGKVGSCAVFKNVAQNLRGFGRRPDHGGVSVLINKQKGKRKSGILKVVGDIGREDIEKMLKRRSDRGEFCYDIRILC